METLRHLFSSAEFRPHGYCYLWNAKLIWLHVLSDGLIFAAYQSIPFMLIYFARQRRHLPCRWMFWLFGAFFVSCGLTHGMEIWTLWHADYWLSGVVKAVTAVASVSTAVLLAKLVPQAARLPSLGAAPEPTAVRPGRSDFGSGRHLWLAYGLGVVTTAAVLLVIEALGHEASTNTPVIVFIIPIIFSAYVGGLVPGLIFTALSAFVTLYFVLLPAHSMSASSPSDKVKWMVLTVAGALISVMSEALHRARVRAQADEARLAAIIASAMDAIIAVDAGQRIALFNPAAEKMFGYNAADVVGQPHDVLIPERFRSAHAEHIRAFGEAHISRRKMADLGTINGVRADGKEFPVEASISRTELGGQSLFTVIMRDITQRQRDEQTRSYLASIVESSDDAIIGRDLEGTIVSWNPGAQKLYGYSPEEAIGRPGSILVPPERREELGDTPERVKRGQSIHHYETMRMRKDGQRIQVAVTVSPIKDGEGQVMGSSTITRDITGQKRAEEELYRSKQMLQLVLDNIPQRVFWKDRNFRFRGCNRALLADSGLKSFADVIGKNDFELPWKESARLYRQDDAQVLEAGVPKLDYEEPETYPDGHTRWLRTSKVPLRNQEGKVIGILGTAEDITERKQAEALLQLWTKALEAAANGVVIAGRDGTIVWLNEAVTALTGYSAHELLGRNLRIFKSGKQDAAFYQNLWQTILAGKVWHGEIINRRKDGSLYPEEMTITPVRDSGGSITHFIAIKQDITERKQADEALQRSEARFRTLFEKAPLAIGISRNGVTIYVNQMYLSMYGLQSVDEVVGRSIGELWSPGSRAVVLERARERSFGLPVPTRYEEVGQRKDGSYFPVQVMVTMVDLPDGPASLGFLTDITERKQAEEALRRKEERYRALVVATSQLVWTTNPQGEIQDSSSWRALTGQSEEEAKGFGWVNALHPDDRERTSGMWSQALKTRSVYATEYRLRRKDGEYRYFAARGVPVLEPNGSIREWVGTCTDITERKQAEDEIKKLNESLEQRVTQRTAELAAANRELEREISERKAAEQAVEELQQRTESILDSAGEGILGLDLTGKCTFANPAAQRMLGYTREELIGQDVHRLARHCLPDGALCDLEECGTQAALKRGVVHQSEDQIVHRKDGLAFPVDQVATPILERGEIVGAVLIFRDVSERRVVEKMKDEFVSVVSHELRTPLTAIRGSLGLLAAGQPSTLEPSRTRRMLEIAVTNTDRLTRLVNDILDAERLEAGHVDLVRADCTASELMLQAADLMRSMAETSRIDLEVKAQPLPLCVNQDSILQVLTNLLSNAIKFSPPCSTVCLEAERDHEVAVFRVSDQGRGIPAEKLESIFGRFQPVDATDTRRRGGTGLGLSICRSIIRRHGGKIWAESEMGRGSTFIFTLPLVVPKGTPLRP